MSIRAPFKRLILRAVLRNLSPMVIRILAVPDSLLLHEFDAVFRAVLGWDNIGGLGPDQQAVGPGGQVGGGGRGLADLHPEQPRIDPELWGTVPAGGDHQYGVCGVDDQPGGEPAVCEEAADAVDAERSALAVTDADEGPQ